MQTAVTASPAGLTLVGPRTVPKVTGMPTSGLMVLVGDTKTGKTTLAASFPDSYVIELEHKRGDRIKQGRVDDLVDRFYASNTDPAQRDAWLLNVAFGELLQAAIADESVKTIVIDSVDELAKLISADIAREAGVEFIGKAEKNVDNRALWGEYLQRIIGLTDFLKECGKLVVMVAHRRPAELDDKGRITRPAGINVSGKGGDYLVKHAEIIGYMDVRVLGGKSTYFLTFKGESERAIWRSGVRELQDKEIVISEVDPYGSFAAAFGEKPAMPKPSLLPAKPKANGKKR